MQGQWETLNPKEFLEGLRVNEPRLRGGGGA
jgi:hypothetical protein